MTPRIVVAGGGAGGIECAIRLAHATGKGAEARVILIDPLAWHLWKPRLHEVAVGLLVAADERASYAELAKMHGFEFVLGPILSVDCDQRTLNVGAVTPPDNPDAKLPERSIAFDMAVLSIGSTVDDFGVSGVHEHCAVLDTPDGAERLNRAIFAQAARVSAGYQDRLRVAIVGAGTTGVELAADLKSAAGRLPQYRSLLVPEQLEIELLEMADRPLPGVSTDSSEYARRLLEKKQVETRFEARVVKVEAGLLHLADGETVSADILVWASGVRGRSIAVSPPPRIERGGRMRVDPSLRLIDAAGQVIPHIYALGDCAACFEDDHSHPVGATAQAAKQQGRLLARSIALQLRGRPPLPFHFHYRGTLVSLGAGNAVGDVPAGRLSFSIAGTSAKIAYRALYRQHLITLFGVLRTLALTLAASLRRSAQPAVKLHW